MPCASYQCNSTFRWAPFGRRIVAMPFSFLHRPRPYPHDKKSRRLSPSSRIGKSAFQLCSRFFMGALPPRVLVPVRRTSVLSGGRQRPRRPPQSPRHPSHRDVRPSARARCWTAAYRPSTTSIPESTSPSCARGNLPVRSVSSALSRLTTCETLATESFGSPVKRGESITLPGALAHLRLLVSGTQIAVAIRLLFSASPCTTTTGLQNPGPDPVGLGRSAHQISP